MLKNISAINYWNIYIIKMTNKRKETLTSNYQRLFVASNLHIWFKWYLQILHKNSLSYISLDIPQNLPIDKRLIIYIHVHSI